MQCSAGLRSVFDHVLLCSCVASAAPAAHPETAAAEECITARERSSGSSFWTPCCSSWTHPAFCSISSLVSRGLLCSSNRHVWTSPTPLPWHSEAWWGSGTSSTEVPWRFPRGTAEGLQPQQRFPPKAEPPQRAGGPRTSPEVRGAARPGPDLV